MNTPDPGTDEAFQLGCICPSLPRQPVKETNVSYTQLVKNECPLHGWKDNTYPGS